MKKAILLISALLLLNVSCKYDIRDQYTYWPPEHINDGFEVGTLDEVNIDTKLIVNAVNNILGGRYKEVHSMLIFRDNKLVFEAYFKGHKYQWDGAYHHGALVDWDRSMLHDVKSVTKSITSACIGVAIDKGFIESVHQSIFDYLPEHQHLNRDGKDKITIEHLLTMTSGLEWDEWGVPYASMDNDVLKLWFPPCENQITCVLEKPLVDEPGTSFTYSGGGMIVLGEIIKNATKMDIDKFSQKYLFKPLKIDSSNWAVRFESGLIESAGGLEITPRAMAKIGVVFLNKGVWDGKQIISEQWVEKSALSYQGNSWYNHFLRPVPPGEHHTWGRKGYSYSWWTYQFSDSGKKIKMFYAGGWGGQHIMVIPDLNAAVVFTGGNYLTKRPPFEILKKYVVPAFD